MVCLLTAAVVLFCPSVPLSASELSLTEVRDKVPPLRRLDPGLMPLPDTACGLEWSSLVNAAKAYEGEDGNTSGLGLFNLVSESKCDMWGFVDFSIDQNSCSSTCALTGWCWFGCMLFGVYVWILL